MGGYGGAFMTSRDFCFWLQGFFELADDEHLDPGQLGCIKRHLALVFKHEIDPSAGDAAHQEKLNEEHKPPVPVKPEPLAPWHSHGPIDGAVYRC